MLFSVVYTPLAISKVLVGDSNSCGLEHADMPFLTLVHRVTIGGVQCRYVLVRKW